eukprot:10392090-Heterocapsa_arctica.AAC.1
MAIKSEHHCSMNQFVVQERVGNVEFEKYEFVHGSLVDRISMKWFDGDIVQKKAGIIEDKLLVKLRVDASSQWQLEPLKTDRSHDHELVGPATRAPRCAAGGKPVDDYLATAGVAIAHVGVATDAAVIFAIAAFMNN